MPRAPRSSSSTRRRGTRCWATGSSNSFATAPGALTAPIEGTSLTAVFGIASVGGSAGCNQYTGTYGTNGNVVRIGRLATTRIACADEIMTQEAAFLAAMEGAALIDRRGPTLMLTDLRGDIARGPGPTVDRAGRVAGTVGGVHRRHPRRVPTAAPTADPDRRPHARPRARRRRRPRRRPCRRGRRRHRPSNRHRRSRRPRPATSPAGRRALASIVYPASWSTLTHRPNSRAATSIRSRSPCRPTRPRSRPP